MITRSAALQHTPAWQRALAEAVRDPVELLELLGLRERLCVPQHPLALQFPLRVPRGFVARMVPGDAEDPLLRQVLPLDREGQPTPGFSADPLGEVQAIKAPGLLHKYQGRVLLAVTGACAVHCRYCFRRHFPYQDAQAGPGAWEEALAHIRSHREIEEVLLSGGDPLTLSDRRLAELADRIQSIGHIKRLRIHTRQPVVLPERVDEGLLAWLKRLDLPLVMVIHSNHPNELDETVAGALKRLRQAGLTLLNQSVLLRGVNDDPETLVRHQERLFDLGVLPYYLHMLDPVQGAAHFAVDESRARQLLADLQRRLPGYLLPRLVREEAGTGAKTWLPLPRPALGETPAPLDPTRFRKRPRGR